MQLREMTLSEHTKQNCNKIVSWVGRDKKRFDSLFELFLHDEYRVTQRVAWPLSYCAISYPALLNNNVEKLVNNLRKPHLHDAIKRNTLRLLQEIEIPKKYDGVVMEICFNYLESPAEAVAIKSFSLTILGKLAKKYPEIISEIKLLIEKQINHQTAAFKSRAKKFLKEFGD